MARLPSFFQTLLRSHLPISAAAIAEAEVAGLQVFAEQAIEALDAAEYGALVRRVARRIGREAVPRPVNSLRDEPGTARWLAGVSPLRPEDRAGLRHLQRALLKIGVHHPAARSEPALMQLPWGADGAMGPATRAALTVAVRLGGGGEVALAPGPLAPSLAPPVEGLLEALPPLAHPDLSGIPRRAPGRPLVLVVGGAAAPVAPEGCQVEVVRAAAETDAIEVDGDRFDLADPAGREAFVRLAFHPRLTERQAAAVLGALGHAGGPPREGRAVVARVALALHRCDDPGGELALQTVLYRPAETDIGPSAALTSLGLAFRYAASSAQYRAL